MKFPNLPAASAIFGPDIFPFSQGGVDKKSSFDLIVQEMSGSLDAASIPFANSAFTADNVEDAILEASAGSGGLPAGSNGEVQYNNAGAFGAEAGFEYNAGTNTLSIVNITATGLALTAASASGGAGLRVPHGTAPTTPTNGDIWTTTAGMYVRVNGVTVGPLGAATGTAWGAITGTLSSQTDLQAALDAKAPLSVPQNSQSTAYTLVLSDAGKHILHPSADTTARIFTIPANSAVAFPVGTVVTFVNQNAAGVITIAITTDTMRLAGAGTTGSRTLAANGIATALKITSTEWIVNGTGLT